MYIPHGCSKKIIIFTGAGLSAESGISTFRDSDGLWENHKIDEVCNDFTWKNNRDIVHKFYNERRAQLENVGPNEAHKTIARIKEKYGDDCYVITQNVDDLLERAGVKEIMHVHGELTKMECTACGEKWSVGYDLWDSENDRCKKCDSKKGVKPSIVFFGGMAPAYKYMHRIFENLEHPETVLIVVGTMGNVVRIGDVIGRKWTEYAGKQIYKKTSRATTILNNMEPNDYLPDVLFDHRFYEGATIALPKIEKWLNENFEISGGKGVST